MTYGATMDRYPVSQAITPLRLIFWGGLLCIFDFHLSSVTSGQGFKIDIVSDTVGAILIAIGVYRLSVLPVHQRYKSRMKFVFVVSILGILAALQDHFVPPLFSLDYLAFNLFAVLNLGAIVIFCIAMRWFCENANLNRAAKSWSTTTVLFVTFFLIPLGVFYLMNSLAIATGTTLDLGPLGLLILPILAIPLVHLFMSTSRMKRAAEQWVPLRAPHEGAGSIPDPINPHYYSQNRQ